MYFIYESGAPGRLVAIPPGENEVRSLPAWPRSQEEGAVPSAGPAALAGNRPVASRNPGSPNTWPVPAPGHVPPRPVLLLGALAGGAASR